MKIREVLTEAKQRIEHPEDRIFDDGSAGAKAALESLKDAATSSKNISIKFDGTPALIAGNVDGHFVMTDKGGLAKGQLPKTNREMYSMIFDRKPDQAGRSEYSTQLSGLFQAIQKIIPKNFPGLIQFDVMWFTKPPLVEDVNPTGTTYYQFKPNKVLYNIPSKSEIGKQIMSSRYGIVVHSYFETPEDEEPRAINDFHALGLLPSKEVVVLNPKATFEIKSDSTIIGNISVVEKLVNTASKRIDDFLNREELSSLKISDLPALMKKFLSSRASSGISESKNLHQEFWNWINQIGLTDSKKKNILAYLQFKSQSSLQLWNIVSKIIGLKNEILATLNSQRQDIQASINGENSHEGYVVDAPSGKVKIVNRPLFMRK
jgi:hypothetical protein